MTELTEFTTEEMMHAGRCSQRQIDYWTRRGWLHIHTQSGSGHPRGYSEKELDVLTTATALIRCGWTPAAAFDTARKVETS